MSNIGSYSYIYPRHVAVNVMAAELRAKCVRIADGFHVETSIQNGNLKCDFQETNYFYFIQVYSIYIFIYIYLYIYIYIYM